MFFAFYNFGELSFEVPVVHLVFEVHVSDDGGILGECSPSEGGHPRHEELDDIVIHGDSQVPGDGVGAPFRFLSSNIEIHLAVPGRTEVRVGPVHLPVEVSDEVSPGAFSLHIESVLQEESFGLPCVVGQSALPADLRLQPVATSKVDLGLEGVLSQEELLPVDLQLSLVTRPSGDNIKSSPLPVVDGDLQFLVRPVDNSHLELVHDAVDLVQEGGHVERHLVRNLIGGQKGLHGGLGALFDLALHVELVEQNYVFI